MRRLTSFMIFLCTGQALALNNAYLPANNEYATRRPLATEYFSYSAPPEDDQSLSLQAARQLAKAFTPPQQVIFIRNPESNLFTLTAKQLAANNALDIYVLQRQMDATALEQEKAAIEQQLGLKPSVHFVKYRTPTDVSRAINSLRSKYEQLPGRSYNHAVETASVIRLNPPPHPAQPDPVVFKILPRNSAEYETHEQASEVEAAKLQALFRQYLPPARRR
ncbi:PREDICTED: uncharacterized protein LOC108608883 [Drosophila arizonae]|uniref:Uncharacterized protein LOC108608883 n=1 Tax=Drosophila arizonae TaxID=7263 RepID=A0ABM1NLZ6_DROAR|nr:PREDICTED: uncharacterized protein LOC108608883 [Drosophila arizonae]